MKNLLFNEQETNYHLTINIKTIKVAILKEKIYRNFPSK